MNNKNYYFSNASVNDRINKEKINIKDQLVKEFNSIQGVCEYIASNKHSTEVNDLLVEELSELIKAVMKLERYNFSDNSLRCNYHEIYNNIYEEISDVYIMLFQFIYKNRISYKGIIDKMSEKIVRYFETKAKE